MTAYDPRLEEEQVAELGWDEANDLPDDFYGEGLPKPLFWRMLVMPVQPKKVSKGGIALPFSSQEAQRYLNYMGKVVAMGELAGEDKRLNKKKSIWRRFLLLFIGVPKQAKAFPKLNDYVVYGRYAGQVLTYKGVRLLIINDDELLAVIKDPDALKVQI
jgi:co-chaperonin GroES (HSP10)